MRFGREWVRNSSLCRLNLQSSVCYRRFWMSLIIILFICVILMNLDTDNLCQVLFLYMKIALWNFPVIWHLRFWDLRFPWQYHCFLGWETMSSGRSFLLFLWNFGDIIPYVRFSIQVIGLVLTSCFKAPICSVWPPSSFDSPSLACHWPQLSLICPPTHNSAVPQFCSVFTHSSILCLQHHCTCVLWLAALITLWTYLHLLLVPHALCFHLYLGMEENPYKGHC